MARASLKKAKLGPKDCGSGEPHGKQKKPISVSIFQLRRRRLRRRRRNRWRKWEKHRPTRKGFVDSVEEDDDEDRWNIVYTQKNKIGEHFKEFVSKISFLKKDKGENSHKCWFLCKTLSKYGDIEHLVCQIDAFLGCKLVFQQILFLFFSWRKRRRNKGSPPRLRKKNSKKKNKKKSSKDDDDERVPFLVPLVIMPGVRDGKTLSKTGILQNNNIFFRMRTRVSRTATRSCPEQVFKNCPKSYKN